MAEALGRRDHVEAALRRFCSVQGLSGSPFAHDVVEAFCAQGLAGRSEATVGTYRSVLRAQLGPVLPVRPPRYRGAPAKAPYSATERAELVSLAASQPRAWRGEAALVVLAAGVGAGLRSAEMIAARGADVGVAGGRTVLSVRGRRARTVEVVAPFAEPLRQAADRVGDDHLLHPGGADRRYHNFVNAICSGLVADPGAPALNVARCRSSYVCDRLAEGTPVSAVLSLSGIGEVESLLRYALHVPGAPHTKAALRRALRASR